MDKRSKETFCQDIAKATKTEKDILTRWLGILEKQYGHKPWAKDHGCSNDGRYLKNSEVTAAEDYEVEGYGLVEVKFSYSKLKETFHLKTRHVTRYLKNRSNILFVDGWESNNPRYTVISPDTLERLVAKAQIVPCHQFGGKEAYRFNTASLLWKEFNV